MTTIYRLFFKKIKELGALLLLTGLLAFTCGIQQDTPDDYYYVYADSWIHGIPTGFMGERDGKSISLNDAWTDKPYKGDKCIKITVDKTESWRGLHVQYTGAWNISLDEKTELPDLSEYDKLEFYAKAIPDASQDMYLIPELGVGGGGGFEDTKYHDSYIEIGTEWKKYSVNLKKADLKRINTMLYFTLPEGTLYLDEIRFVKRKSKK